MPRKDSNFLSCKNERGITVKCPNLVEWVNWTILLCKAGDKPYVPTLSELDEYCKSEDYNKCFFYLDLINKKKDIEKNE